MFKSRHRWLFPLHLRSQFYCLAVNDDTVTVGILRSSLPVLAISETGSTQAKKLAITTNESGGVLGRQIKHIQEDGASDWPTFAEKSRKLLLKDKEGSNGLLDFQVVKLYTCFQNYTACFHSTFAGLEESPNVIYTGQEATQQILKVLTGLLKLRVLKLSTC